MYRLLREEQPIVEEFWLELLYHVVKCLALSEDDDHALGTKQQTTKALDHIERVLKEKADHFNKVGLCFLFVKIIRIWFSRYPNKQANVYWITNNRISSKWIFEKQTDGNHGRIDVRIRTNYSYSYKLTSGLNVSEG